MFLVVAATSFDVELLFWDFSEKTSRFKLSLAPNQQERDTSRPNEGTKTPRVHRFPSVEPYPSAPEYLPKHHGPEANDTKTKKAVGEEDAEGIKIYTPLNLT